MSEAEPKGPYVYQPYGAITNPEHNAADRLWGVGGVSSLAMIKGLTKLEAERVCKLLTVLRATDLGGEGG